MCIECVFCAPLDRFQYADDTTLYLHSKVCDLQSSVSEMNNVIHSQLGSYSNYCNLSLNKMKTNWMLVSTAQMSRVHSLDKRPLHLTCDGATLDRTRQTKLLGVYLDDHLSWSEHVTKTLPSCYGSLAVLRKLRHFAPFS